MLTQQEFYEKYGKNSVGKKVNVYYRTLAGYKKSSYFNKIDGVLMIGSGRVFEGFVLYRERANGKNKIIAPRNWKLELISEDAIESGIENILTEVYNIP